MKKFYMCFLAFLWFINPAAAESDTANIDDSYVQQLITKNDYAQLQNLIRNGLDVNSRDSDGETLLFYALMNGANLKTVQLLLEYGADVNAPSMNSGMTPLLITTSTADELQKQALQIYEQNTAAGKRAMIEAKLKQQISQQMLRATKMLRLLIDNGADINQETPFGTPIMNASGNEWNLDIIDILIKAGANVNQQDRNGRTALFYASVHNADKIISRLMAAGADINITDYNGKTYMEITKEDMFSE